MTGVQARLEALKKLREREPEKRWQAHYDLMLAQTAVFQIKAYEYRTLMGQLAQSPQAPTKPSTADRVVAFRVDHSAKPLAPHAETGKRYAEAKRLLDDVIAKHARAADLVVGYPARRGVDRALYATPDGLLMEAGLPILLIPAAEVEFRAETVLLAWKNTQEARRAISVAMPLLQKAERVLVAAVCRDREVATIEQELADVAARLARHGVKVATLVEVEAPGAAGRRLLHIAEADKSDLIVAGGYGHSRLREWALGGVTRDLIADGRRFVLLSR